MYQFKIHKKISFKYGKSIIDIYGAGTKEDIFFGGVHMLPDEAISI